MAAIAIGLGLLAVGCARPEPRDLDATAEAYVKLVLALGERDPDSLDFFAGPSEWADAAKAAYRPLPAIAAEARALEQALEQALGTAPEAAVDERRRYLSRHLRAVAARIEVLSGRGFRFDEETELLFDITAPPYDPAAVRATRAELGRLLPGVGGLGQRRAAFERRFIIPPERVPAVFARALEECRRATQAGMPLPPGEQAIVEDASNMPWAAFTRYEGQWRSRIRLNREAALTVDRALELACHEGYPGHHAINLLIDAERVVRARRLEFTVLPLFSPQSLRTEAAATVAVDLAFPGDERVRVQREVLFPLAGLDASGAGDAVRVARLVARLGLLQADIARRYLDGELEFVRAAAALEDDAAMPSADALLKFLNEYRSYAVTYTAGAARVAARLDAAARDADPNAGWAAYRAWVLAPSP